MLCLVMRKSLLLGALCAYTFGFSCAPIRAQQVPVALGQNTMQSGYDLLLEARALLKNGPNGEPSAAEKLSPDENLRRQRLAVARNAPALAKLRAALQAGIAVPTSNNTEVPDFTAFAGARELARQLYQEAAVRSADGDAMGAAQSGLTSLELGAQMSHGPLINSLVGIAIRAIGRRSLERNVARLDAAHSRQVARQIETTGAQMQTQTEMLRAEAEFGAHSIDQIFADFDDPQKRAQMQGDYNKDPTDEFSSALIDLMKLSPAAVKADYEAQFGKAIARASMPYAAQAAPIHGDIAYVNMSLDVITSPSSRFNFERDIVSDRLLSAALQLHAAKLESGQYPATFDAGVDPFSPTLAPLTYKRAGDAYVLYSVGPDGKDNDGAEIQTIFIDEETGAKTVSDRLTPDSTGDIVAPVL